MKLKTINAVISKKIDDWLNNIDDLNVVAAVKNNIIVTGGAIASMLAREPVNDYDIYFTTKEAALAAANYYVRKYREQTQNKENYTPDIAVQVKQENSGERIYINVKSVGAVGETQQDIDQDNEINNLVDSATVKRVTNAVQTFTDSYRSDLHVGHSLDTDAGSPNEEEVSECSGKYEPKFISCNAISLSDKVQLVFRFFGPPKEIHANFDFVHCTNYWTPQEGTVVNKEALLSIMSKELRYVGSRYPLCSIFRVRKFVARGWTINAGQMLKMAWQLNQLNLANIDVLRDQLVGVDTTYFIMMVDSLQHQLDKGNITVITGDYLFELIDRIF